MTTQTILNTFEAIEQRRSVKYYDKNHIMSEEEIHKLLSLALLSPTSFNVQHWRFVVIDRRDPDLRKSMRDAAFGQAQAEDASIVVVLCASLNAWQNPKRYWHLAPQPVLDYMVPAITNCYKDNPELALSEAQRSCGIAGQTIMLAAKAMGYDSCPMAGFDPDMVGDLIHVPEDHIVNMLITVGKAAQPARPRSGQLSYEEVVFRQRF